MIIDIIHDIAPDEDLSDVKPDVRLRDQLDPGLDGLPRHRDGAEKRHQIEVPEEDYMKLATLDGCVEYLAPKFAA